MSTHPEELGWVFSFISLLMRNASETRLLSNRRNERRSETHDQDVRTREAEEITLMKGKYSV